jgi:hypothetical protein
MRNVDPDEFTDFDFEETAAALGATVNLNESVRKLLEAIKTGDLFAIRMTAQDAEVLDEIELAQVQRLFTTFERRISN